jgi:predicted DNA binding CopG/RHH family protein
MTTTKHKTIKFLDEEEKELYESVEQGEWVSVSEEEKEKDLAEFKRVYDNTFKKTRPISLRVNEVDLMKLKAQALEEGLPYQTLLSSIIHKYVTVNSYSAVNDNIKV